MSGLRARQDVPRSEQAITAPYSSGAPVGGWNTRDPMESMDPLDAILMDNWVARTQSIETRAGAVDWATSDEGGLQDDAEVETLLSYEPASGTRALFAFSSDGEIYNVTAGGAATTALVTGLSNARWQGINFANSGGTWLLAVNGADSMRQYNGTTWSAIDTVNGGAKNTSDFIHINAYKQRIFVIEKASLQFWYNTSAGAFTGTYAAFETRQLFTKGGFLMAMGTWTFDGGSGPDDRAAFITSEGEVAVFTGTDPGNSAAWSIVGVYFIGKPLGRRCLIKYGGDLLILTERGLFPLTKALNAGDQAEGSALTNKIDSAFNAAALTNSTTFGWDMTIFPRQTLGIVNVPTTPAVQFVWNLLSGSWSRFTGWAARCFVVFNDTLYFGTTGKVVKAYTGTSDFGDAIQFPLMTAFNYFNTPGEPKKIALLRPTFESDGAFGYLLGVNSDFSLDTPSGLITSAAPAVALWDSATWDSAIWGVDALITRHWQTVFAWDGFCHSTYLKVATPSVRVKLRAFDYKIAQGSGL